jgi:hypothetical protein
MAPEENLPSMEFILEIKTILIIGCLPKECTLILHCFRFPTFFYVKLQCAVFRFSDLTFFPFLHEKMAGDA